MAKVTIYKTELRRFLNTPHDDRKTLWKWLEETGDKAVLGAKRKVGVKTGALRNSIHKRHLGNLTGQYLWIGSEKGYAELHHNGSRPHMIRPISPNRTLIFSKGSRLVFASQVMHPGTKPNPYLSSQLRHFVTK
jgi:hypothetical protein